MIPPLKSGDRSGRDWRHINHVGAGAQFTQFETIATRDAMYRRNRELRVPLGGGGLGFRGEYDPGGIYSLQQFVIISMGANAGTYIYVSGTASTGSTGANPTTSPWLGGGQWVQLPGGNGSWL